PGAGKVAINLRSISGSCFFASILLFPDLERLRSRQAVLTLFSCTLVRLGWKDIFGCALPESSVCCLPVPPERTNFFKIRSLHQPLRPTVPNDLFYLVCLQKSLRHQARP